MVNETILAVIIVLVISAILCPIVYCFFTNRNLDRSGGTTAPLSPFWKSREPSMGVTAIFQALLLSLLLYLKVIRKITPVLFVTAGFWRHRFPETTIRSKIGREFWRDLSRQKLAGQIIITGIFACIILLRLGARSERRCLFRSRAIPGYAGPAF